MTDTHKDLVKRLRNPDKFQHRDDGSYCSLAQLCAEAANTIERLTASAPVDGGELLGIINDIERERQEGRVFIVTRDKDDPAECSQREGSILGDLLAAAKANLLRARTPETDADVVERVARFLAEEDYSRTQGGGAYKYTVEEHWTIGGQHFQNFAKKLLAAAHRTAQGTDAGIDTALHLFRGEQISFGKMMEIAHTWRKGEPFTLPSNIQVSSDLDALVDRFLAWPLPDSVCSDQCATVRNFPHPRSGTNLLDANEARQMLKYLLSATSLSPQAGVSEWQPIETAPLAEMVWLWNPVWRHAFPGQRNGDFGECYIDTCEPKAAGWQAIATHWMPMSSPRPASKEAAE